MVANEVLVAAQPVCTAARAHADETEAGRRLARSVVEAFESSGLGAALAPIEIGGSGGDLIAVLEAIEAISIADASAGWCAAIGIGSNYLASLVPRATAGELFRDLRKGGAGPFAPGSMAMPNDSGVHVAGRWSYASNCQQAAVAAAGVVLCDANGPMLGPAGVELGLAFLGDDDFGVVECWDMDGLRGTGSHDIVADLDLEPARVTTLWATKWPDEALSRLRTFDVLGPSLAMVPLAIGRSALDVLRATTIADAAGQPRPGPRPRVADDPVAQLRIGQTEIRLCTARTMLVDLVGEALAAGARGDTPMRRTSALIGLACGQALAAGRDAVQTASELLGSAGAREGSPMLRLRRDIFAAGTHIMFSHHLQVGLGRELAGLPTAAFPFLPGVVD